jgi:hypothetical protein
MRLGAFLWAGIFELMAATAQKRRESTANRPHAKKRGGSTAQLELFPLLDLFPDALCIPRCGRAAEANAAARKRGTQAGKTVRQLSRQA